jgi:hypothetical protein
MQEYWLTTLDTLAAIINQRLDIGRKRNESPIANKEINGRMQVYCFISHKN